MGLCRSEDKPKIELPGHVCGGLGGIALFSMFGSNAIDASEKVLNGILKYMRYGGTRS
jgi:hypothetical protein